MAEESTTPATSSAILIPPTAEQEESAPEKRSDAPEEEEEAKEALLADEKEAPNHKRKLDELEKEAEEEKNADLNPAENAAEVEEKADGDAKRQKINGDAGVDGIQGVHNLKASMEGNGQPPNEGTLPGSVEISQTSELVSEQGTLPSVGQDVPSSRKIEVPNNKVGVLIGKAGETIRNLQRNSGAQIQITRDAQADPSSTTRSVELIGTLEHINKAEQLIKDVMAEADAGGSPALVAQGYGAPQFGTEVFEMQVSNEKVGMVIGKGGNTIRNLQATSGAKIQLIPQHLPEGDVSKERTVLVTGNKKQIEVAKEMVKEVMNKIQLYLSHGGQYWFPGVGTAPFILHSHLQRDTRGIRHKPCHC